MDAKAMNNERCPRCGKQTYDNRNMKLFVAPCGHFLCDRCLDDIFHTRPVARCDTCLADRRRTDYFPKIFDSGEVHREVFVRKHDVGDFALVRQEDMPGDTPEEKLNHYNDYLEEVEDITYALTYHAKSEATVNRIESLLGRFGHIIQANKKREADQQRQRVLELRIKRKQENEKRRIAEERAKEQQEQKQREYDQFLKKLTSANDASKVVEERKSKLKQEMLTMSSAPNAAGASDATTLPIKDEDVDFNVGLAAKRENPLWKYRKPTRHIHGPVLPPTPQLPRLAATLPPRPDHQKAMAAVSAGGYVPEFTARRAIEEAYACLFI